MEQPTDVLRVNRLRTAADEPLAVQVSHLPPPNHELSIGELKRTTFDAEGRPFGYVVSAYRSERCWVLLRSQAEALLAWGPG